MRIRPASAAAALALSALAFTGAAAPAVAQTPICDPYSTNCTTPPPPQDERPTVRDRSTCTESLRTTVNPDGTETTVYTQQEPGPECLTTTTTARTLPFTGGELVLLSAVAAGALAGGVALVVAGRRRKPAVA